MSESQGYIDTCVQAAASVDVVSLSRLEPGKRIGGGEQFAMRALGEVPILGETVFAGLKLSKKNGLEDHQVRLQQELPAIELLLERIPELTPKVPRFMGLLAIEGSDAVAILTEDATRGNQVTVRDVRGLDMFPLHYVDLISNAFRGAKDIEVDDDAINSNLVFEALLETGNEDRFLDFTPPPVRPRGALEDELNARLYDLIFDQKALTVNVSAESPLGLSLADRV